jgi:hypothetical protein
VTASGNSHEEDQERFEGSQRPSQLSSLPAATTGSTDEPMAHPGTVWGALLRSTCQKISTCVIKSGGTISVGMKNAEPRKQG